MRNEEKECIPVPSSIGRRVLVPIFCVATGLSEKARETRRKEEADLPTFSEAAPADSFTPKSGGRLSNASNEDAIIATVWTFRSTELRRTASRSLFARIWLPRLPLTRAQKLGACARYPYRRQLAVYKSDAQFVAPRYTTRRRGYRCAEMVSIKGIPVLLLHPAIGVPIRLIVRVLCFRTWFLRQVVYLVLKRTRRIPGVGRCT